MSSRLLWLSKSICFVQSGMLCLIEICFVWLNVLSSCYMFRLRSYILHTFDLIRYRFILSGLGQSTKNDGNATEINVNMTETGVKANEIHVSMTKTDVNAFETDVKFSHLVPTNT